MLIKTKFKLSLCFKYRLFAHFVNICAYIRIFMHILYFYTVSDIIFRIKLAK